MSNEKMYKIAHLVYVVMLSFLLTVLAILLIISCIEIYQSSEAPFSRQSVGDALLRLAPFGGMVVLWVIVGIFLFPAVDKPDGKRRLRGTTSMVHTLKTLSGKLDESRCSDEHRKQLGFERRLRICITIGVAVAWGFAAGFALINTLNEANFPADDPNAEVLHGALTVLCCLVFPFALSLAVLFINQASRKRELAVIKAALREGAGKSKDAPLESDKKCVLCTFIQKYQDRILTITRIVVLAAGVILLIVGISNGGARDVVQKAIKICRECIGLG